MSMLSYCPVPSLPVSVGREPFHGPELLGNSDGEGEARQHQGRRAGRQGLPGAGGFSEQKGHGTTHGAGTAGRTAGWGAFMIDVAEHSLRLVPMTGVVIALWKCLCLPQPWGTAC